ncbi:MAG TPA: helicase-related protein [Xanthobacteraceae bacterium]|nr:helicase-related protein [Xanthobacteraceae bacterium]
MTISFSTQARDTRARGAGVTAVLGPTNTGKTHLAIERMLAHSSGLIGLPLRLLAREVYNKCVERVGSEAVALVTGEEKIKPANPRFWVATVEAMPRDLDVAFLAVDEIQLAADLERGHVFTDRILNRRGREETLILGAATMRPMVDKLLPGANVLSRPRLSTLSFAGDKKITRLPRRAAIVAFSTEEVYAIAELIRRQRGGAAVVLGALSPRTRNAQVALYQSGDVDYLVATDAIGMGLNLDVDHVAFASDRKFDGYQYRKLNPIEFAQIAGRAGRATRDGTFGSTGRCPPFEQDLVQALEAHAFDPVRVLQWRSSELDFSSLGALSASLTTNPTQAGLTRAPVAEDILVLEHAARDEEVRAFATTRAAIERLWDVCQVPDYRKISPAAHAELVTTLYSFLMRDGSIPDDWFSHQIAQADRTDGGIDTLSTRIAHIRTWTFAANRPDWLKDPEHWQGVARAVEDRLSDALHDRLAERFVDRRTSVLMRRLKENTMLETEISKTGDVIVEGHNIGRLEGFRFAADVSAGGSEAKALSGAAQKALAGEIEARATRLSHAPDSQFVLASDGTIRWVGDAVAKLTAGDNALRPRVRILADEHLTGAPLEAVQTRLDLWAHTHIERALAPLFVLGAAEDITGLARGIAYQIVEALGVLERSKVAEDVKGLDQESRATLRKHGVRFGAYHIYVPGLLKPGPRSLAAQLWALKYGGPDVRGLDELQRLAASGRTSFPADKETNKQLYRTIGYRVCGERAVRVDILERLADLIRPALAWREGVGQKPPSAFDGRGFVVTQAMTSLTGSSGEDFASVLRALGYRLDRRPKPVEAARETAAGPESDELAGATDATEATAQSPTPSEAALGADAPAITQEMPVVSVDAQPSPADAEGEAPPVRSGADIAPLGSETGAAASPDPLASLVAAHAAAATGLSPAASNVEAASEPQFIDVWRPGRSDERRPRRHHRPPREKKTADAPVPAPAAEQAAPAPDASAPARREEPRRHRDDRRKERDASDRPGGRDGGRPERRERADRRDRPDRQERRRDRRDDDRPPRTWEAGRERRGKEPDPDSPFAKLAALKAQLEADAKDRR